MKAADFEIWTQLMKKVDSRTCSTASQGAGYQRTRVLSKPIAWCLALAPDQRDEAEIKNIQNHLLRSPLYKFSSQMNEEQLLGFAKYCKGLFIPPNSQLAPQGSTLNRFYLVVEGSLIGLFAEQKNINPIKWFLPGDQIGTQCLAYEQELIWNLQSGREGCFMMFLEREDFNRILHFHEVARIDKILSVMKKVDIFTCLKEEKKIQLIFAGNIVMANQHRYIYRAKATTEGFFVILQGKMKKFLKPHEPEDKGQVLSETDYFGYYELLKKQPFRTQSVVCVGKTPAKLIYWNNNTFSRFFEVKSITHSMLNYLKQEEDQCSNPNKEDASKSPRENKLSTIEEGKGQEGENKEVVKVHGEGEKNQFQKALQERSQEVGQEENNLAKNEREEMKVLLKQQGFSEEPSKFKQFIDGADKLQKIHLLTTQEASTQEDGGVGGRVQSEKFPNILKKEENVKEKIPSNLQSKHQMKFLQEQQERFQSFSPSNKFQVIYSESKELRKIVSPNSKSTDFREQGGIHQNTFQKDGVKSPFISPSAGFRLNSNAQSKAFSLHEETNQQKDSTEHGRQKSLGQNNTSLQPPFLKVSEEQLPEQRKQPVIIPTLTLKRMPTTSRSQLTLIQSKLLPEQFEILPSSSTQRSKKSTQASKKLKKRRKFSQDNELTSRKNRSGSVGNLYNLSPTVPSQNIQSNHFNQVTPTDTSLSQIQFNSQRDLTSTQKQFNSNNEQQQQLLLIPETSPIKKQNLSANQNSCNSNFLLNSVMGNFKFKRQSQSRSTIRHSQGEVDFLPNVDFFKMMPFDNTSSKSQQPLFNPDIDRKSSQVSSIKKAISHFFSVGNPRIRSKDLGKVVNQQQILSIKNKSQDEYPNYREFGNGELVYSGAQSKTIYSNLKGGGSKTIFFDSTSRKLSRQSLHLNKQSV